MYRSYSPGAIGVQVEGLAHSMDLARRHGFEGVHFSIDEVLKLGATQAQELAKEKGVRLSAWGFPLNFRASEQEWATGLEALPARAKLAAELEVRRTATWIMPCSDELNYTDNFAFPCPKAQAGGGDIGRTWGLAGLGVRGAQNLVE